MTIVNRMREQLGRLAPSRGYRRRSPRFLVDIEVRILKHRQENRQNCMARDISTGGMRIEPPVVGYVGEHVYVNTEMGLEGIEARIANQEPAGTGLRFVFPLPEELVCRTAGQKANGPYI